MRKKKTSRAGKPAAGPAKEPDYGSAIMPAIVLILMALIVLFVQRHAAG